MEVKYLSFLVQQFPVPVCEFKTGICILVKPMKHKVKEETTWTAFQKINFIEFYNQNQMT